MTSCLSRSMILYDTCDRAKQSPHSAICRLQPAPPAIHLDATLTSYQQVGSAAYTFKACKLQVAGVIRGPLMLSICCCPCPQATTPRQTPFQPLQSAAAQICVPRTVQHPDPPEHLPTAAARPWRTRTWSIFNSLTRVQLRWQ